MTSSWCLSDTPTAIGMKLPQLPVLADISSCLRGAHATYSTCITASAKRKDHPSAQFKFTTTIKSTSCRRNIPCSFHNLDICCRRRTLCQSSRTSGHESKAMPASDGIERRSPPQTIGWLSAGRKINEMSWIDRSTMHPEASRALSLHLSLPRFVKLPPDFHLYVPPVPRTHCLKWAAT